MDSTNQIERSLGSTLRAEREERGLSLGEVAERLKLSVKQLTAIEQDEWHQLPGTTFARGFVRSYARYLALDEQHLLQMLDKSLPTAAPSAHIGDTVATTPDIQSGVADSKPASVKASLWAIGLVMVAAGGYALFSKQPASQTAQAVASAPVFEAPLQTEIVSSDAAPATVASAAQTASLAASTPAAVPAAHAVVAAPVLVASQAANVAPTAGHVAVEVRASAESWVEVRDREGKKLIFGLIPAGGSQRASGVGPLKVRIGNAQAVQLSHNGQPLDISGKIRGSTAKLELN